MARIITKDDEAHPLHPVRVAADKAAAEVEKETVEVKEKKPVEVPKRKTE